MKKRIIIVTKAVLLILCLLIVRSISIAEEQFINPADAGKYVGKEKTVCGTVVSATYASQTNGQPAFLNLDQPSPNQVFTVVIWGVDRKTFNTPPEVFYKGKTICVTGKIKSYKIGPEIMVNDPSQIKFKSNPTSSE
ncbi:MAG: DNA-binding protein [Thermodesulfobacteriota bacterium]|jgi:DNA/RNA endonuclease YhcR with UshA esterase domain